MVGVGWRLLEVAVDGKVDLAGNSIVKNLVEETSSIWAPNRGGFDKIFDKIWATRFLGSFRSH
jgi:hypothetical protein